MNKVTLRGNLYNIEYSHDSYGVKLYKAIINVARNSGTVDKIPVVIPEKILLKLESNGLISLRIDEYVCIDTVTIIGEYRSVNKVENNKRRLELYVFARDIEKDDEDTCINNIELECYICKISECRKTPFNKTICDLIVAVNNDKIRRSSYIPCIVWGKDAEEVSSKLSVGDKIILTGRIQSREYEKDGEIRTAYEVSVSNIE